MTQAKENASTGSKTRSLGRRKCLSGVQMWSPL